MSIYFIYNICDISRVKISLVYVKNEENRIQYIVCDTTVNISYINIEISVNRKITHRSTCVYLNNYLHHLLYYEQIRVNKYASNTERI